jgi:hypothetical protein
MFYKGLYRVKVVTKSEGYWIVEAEEPFEDNVDGERVVVKAGETRIVPSTELHKKKVLSPPVPEHVYERKLEKKVKRMVKEYEVKNLHKKRLCSRNRPPGSTRGS